MSNYFQEYPLRSACLSYFLLALAPGVFFQGQAVNFLAEALIRYLIPGVLACVLAEKFYGGNWRRALGWRGLGRSICCCAPAGVLCAANLLTHSAALSPQKILWICAMALGEELTARFLLFLGLREAARQRGQSAGWAVLASGVLFGLMHAVNFGELGGIQTLLQCLYTAGIGALFAWAYWKSGNLWGPILWHALLNLTGLP